MLHSTFFFFFFFAFLLNCSAAEAKANVVKAADVVLKAPINNCEKVLCIGMNYVDHCTEQVSEWRGLRAKVRVSV